MPIDYSTWRRIDDGEGMTMSVTAVKQILLRSLRVRLSVFFALLTVLSLCLIAISERARRQTKIEDDVAQLVRDLGGDQLRLDSAAAQ